MTEVVLYHHVLGLTDGVQAFADELRQTGHIVHTPDMFEGRLFDSIEDGIDFAREQGFGELAGRGVAAAQESVPAPSTPGFPLASFRAAAGPDPPGEPEGLC